MAGTLALGLALSSCGTALISTAATTGSTTATGAPTTTTTTPIPSGVVAVAFPVVECTTTTGAAVGAQGWKPSILLAPIPTALVGKVEFYSDDVHTVLGPTGWTCGRTATSGGATSLVVYPSNDPNPPVTGPPSPGAEGVFATFDSTANMAGISLVCPFFAVASWQEREAKCPASLPAGEQSSMPTPDVASVTDPPGVVGNLEGSGGFDAVTGTVIFPQVEPAVTDGEGVDVADESCSVPNSTLCAAILSDFDVREFPVPSSVSSGSSDNRSGAPGDSASSAPYSAPTVTRPVVTPTTVPAHPGTG